MTDLIEMYEPATSQSQQIAALHPYCYRLAIDIQPAELNRERTGMLLVHWASPPCAYGTDPTRAYALTPRTRQISLVCVNLLLPRMGIIAARSIKRQWAYCN
jgi:hypothetical protein